MELTDAIILILGGLAAGTINAIAGGGSLLSVPLLVLVGLDGAVANGTNRVGIFLSNLSSSLNFAREGVPGFRKAVPVMIPVAVGSLAGSYLISLVEGDTFQQVFGFLMIPLLILGIKKPKAKEGKEPWSPAVSALVFGAIGLYGGAFQAGVGIILLVALARSGFDLVTANSIKVVVILVLTAIAVPVFILQGQVDWIPALILGAGFIVGGGLGARIAVRGGESVIRPVMILAVLAMTGRMLGLY